MQPQAFQFEADFQILILSFLLKEQGAMVRYRHLLDEAYFTDETLRVLCEVALWYYDNYSSQPSVHTMKEAVSYKCSQSYALKDNTALYLQWVDFLYSQPATDFEYIESRLHDFVAEREYMLAAQKLIGWINDPEKRAQIPDLINNVSVRLAQTHGSMGINAIGMDALTRFDVLFKSDPRDCILSTWPEFNEFCGGFGRGEMTLFAASPNRGKSWALVYAAYAALLAGKKVVFYTCEMSEKMVLQRLYQVISGRTRIELAHDPQGLENFIAPLRVAGGEIVIKQMFNSEVRHVREHLMGVMAQKGWVPDMVVVDYAGLLTQVDVEVDRHVIRTITKSLRDLAVKYHLAMVTAAQLNRGADKKERPTMGDLAECYELAAICDTMWMLCQTEEEEQQHRWRQYNVKNRNEMRGKVISQQLDFSRGKIISSAGTYVPTDNSIHTHGTSLLGPTGPPSEFSQPFGTTQ